MENKDFHVDLIVKLGGSAITVKDRLETLNEESLRKAAELIRDCCQRNLTCIVVHGAGSFGHHQAKKYKVNTGWTQVTQHGGEQTNPDHVKRGFCLTRKSVTKLNQHVLDCLLSKEVPAVGISVCGRWKTNNGKVIECDLNSIKDLLTEGFVPVLHGDCVLDEYKGCGILSGDIIIKKLSEIFTVDRVVFLASVKGVFNRPPEVNTDAELVRRICVYADQVIYETRVTAGENVECQGQNSRGKIDMHNHSTDVTGGMTLKVETGIEIVRNSTGNTKVYICKIGTRQADDVCLSGKVGTDDSFTEFIFLY